MSKISLHDVVEEAVTEVVPLGMRFYMLPESLNIKNWNHRLFLEQEKEHNARLRNFRLDVDDWIDWIRNVFGFALIKKHLKSLLEKTTIS